MLFEFSNEKTRRLIQANRANFDGNAAKHRVRTLEAALAASRAETAALREHLEQLEASTVWRLTHPIRTAITALRAWRRTLVSRWSKPRAAQTATDAKRYEAWIRTSESACRAALWSRDTGYHPTTLGLVLWATPGCRFAIQALLADCPIACTVLILDQDADLPHRLAGSGRILRVKVPPEAQPAESVALALARLDSDLICFLDARDRLAPGALTLAADIAAQFSPLDMIFADEDWLDETGRRTAPFFKPGWDGELQRGRDLAGPFTFLRRDLVQRAAPVSGPAWLYDLTNQVVAATHAASIHHIPAVLCHRTAMPNDFPAALREASATQLARAGIAATVEPHPHVPAWNRVVYALPQAVPLVSIVVPTRDRAALLRVCADGVLNRTDYARLELLIVDNSSAELETLALLDELAADPRVRVLRQPGSFNWSALNNLAAGHAKGSVLVLLNNDTAMPEPDWLTVLVSHAIQPGVGAVGAKLLYPDGRVQHAGLTTNRSGMPRHIFRYLGGNDLGAFGLAGMAREVWGVTGACLAIPTAVFRDVGGLNEAFPLAYNDVELCLRLTAHGYRILWTPWSCLTHHEMATRPPDHLGGRREQVRQELEWLLRDWGVLIERDPFFNPNLQLIEEQPHFRAIDTSPHRL